MSYISTGHGETTSKRIVPNFWCQGNAPEVAELITQAFNSALPGSAESKVTSWYPTDGLLPFQEPLAGAPLTVEIIITGPHGGDILLVLINAGDEFTPNTTLSLMVNFDPLFFDGELAKARKCLTAVWQKLSEGGTEHMPLGAYPFSDLYGWVSDRNHISWQVILTDPEGDPRPFIMPVLLFANESQNRAREAIDRYCTLVPDSGIGNFVPYEAAHGPATEGAVMFADMYIAGEWIVVMDSASEGGDEFNCGASLELRCNGQEELDHVWNTLTSVPEAEVCGWLQDPYGMSWQVTPFNLPELMQKPEAYSKLMNMKKIVIDEF